MKSNIDVQNREYLSVLNEIKNEILSSRINTARKVNRDLIKLYWKIGELLYNKVLDLGWGKSIVQNLSIDLQKEYPQTTGYSPDNLWRMKQFYSEYSNNEFMEQLVPEMKKLQKTKTNTKIMEQLVPEMKNDENKTFLNILSSIPWGHNIEIMKKIKYPKERLYYIISSAAYGWSRNVLLNQIRSKAYQRSVTENKSHNFFETLPVHFAEQADEMLKSTYNLEYLRINEPLLELELERKMIEKVKNFILELGYGFCFIGNQYRITLDGNEYFIDLLFYHRFLKSLVAIELKTGRFKPEYAGKMDFYLNLLNHYERDENDNPSIGIILCSEKNNLEVEFSLKTKSNPIGVVEYKLYKDIPEEMKGKLPSIEDFKRIKG